MFSFVTFIRHSAQIFPQKPAIIMGDRVVTYKMLVSAIDAIAQRLAGLNLPQDGIVGIVQDNPIRHLALAAAIQEIGRPSISLATARGATKLKFPLAALLQHLGDEIIPGLKQIFTGDDWFNAAPSDRARVTLMPNKAEDICRIALSSGTTGEPKAISATLASTMNMMASYNTSLRHGAWDRLLVMPGLTSHWGFTLALHALTSGKTLFMTSDPQSALEILSTQAVDALIASTQQLRDMIKIQLDTFYPCTHLKFGFYGGSAIPPQLRMQAQTLICQHAINMYGSTEAGGTAFAPLSLLGDDESAAGFVTPWSEVEIVDDAGTVLPRHSEGEIRVRSNSMALPFPLHDENAHPGLKEGWFYPGDRGFITESGILHLQGRTTEVLNVGGLKLTADKVENIVRQHPSVEEVVAFLTTAQDGYDEIALIVLEKSPLSVEHLKDWCTNKGLPIAQVYMTEDMPRSAAGKIARADLIKRFQ
jgi:acyl-coenzyme A synthetase/AMP-(fatty) acid ligase